MLLNRARALLADSFKQNTALGYVAILRIMVGYHFLLVGMGKLSRDFLSGEALSRTLSGAVDDPISWHRDFILGVVVPNADIFSYLVCFGELAIAVSLLSGCLVRLSSLFGAFYNLNIYLAIAIPAGGATLGINRIFIILHLVFVTVSAGRALGLDGYLKKRFPRSWLF